MMPETVRELDVRNLPAAQGLSEVFNAFDALGAGEGFVLIGHRDPGAVLRQFQAQRPGAFEWSVLEREPARFRIEIRRRAGDGSRTVTDYLESDHRRLDQILRGVAQLAAAGAFAPAAEQFAEFSCGLNRHIDAEEQILFPSFEQLTGITQGPTVVMRAEHVEIRTEMAIVAATLEAGDASGFTAALARLTNVLSDHNMKEEEIVYPMTDDAAGVEQRDELVRHMQAI